MIGCHPKRSNVGFLHLAGLIIVGKEGGVKMKVTMLYPPDATTNEINDMHLLYLQALEKSGFDVQIVGRITEEEFRKTCPVNLKYVDFFKQGDFTKKLTQEEIEEAERDIGLPFNFIYTCNQIRWGWLERKGIDEKAARYVEVWKKLLKGTDVLITTLDNLYFIYTAEGIAKSMNIPIIKPLKGRLVNNSVIFWNDKNLPIPYKKRQTHEIYDRFVSRAVEKEAVKIHTSSIQNSTGLIGRALNIPKKLFALSRGKVDADIPNIIPKYTELISMGVRLVVNPILNSFIWEKPRTDEYYYLFPLHFEWEANLAYREPFIHQVQLAYQISASLPINTYLYVKVHPHWKNCDQHILDMIDLSSVHNIRIIEPKANTTDLIKNSVGVITINSTVGYEAMLAKKPLVVIGHEWFRECVGVEDVKDLSEELPRALLKILYGECKTESYDTFLKAYADCIVPVDDNFANEMKEAIIWISKKE